MAIKHRHVFRTDGIDHANGVVQLAISRGVGGDDAYIVAKPDIEMRRVGGRRKMADSDLIPAAIRGVLLGFLVGAVLSVVIMLIYGPALYLFFLCAGVGAAVGGLGSSLAGASIEDPVRRQFRNEIDSGAVLVVIDVNEDGFAMIREAMTSAGAVQLPYDAASAMT